MQPLARQGDQVQGIDVHIVLVPSPGGPVPTPGPHPFSGSLTGGTIADVVVEGRPVAVVGSSARSTTPHLPVPPTGSFQNPPRNEGSVTQGSTSVFAGGKPVARLGDPVATCTDLPAPGSTITSGATRVVAS